MPRTVRLATDRKERPMKFYDLNKLESDEVNPSYLRKAVYGETLAVARIEVQQGVCDPASFARHGRNDLRAPWGVDVSFAGGRCDRRRQPDGLHSRRCRTFVRSVGGHDRNRHLRQKPPRLALRPGQTAPQQSRTISLGRLI